MNYTDRSPYFKPFTELNVVTFIYIFMYFF